MFTPKSRYERAPSWMAAVAKAVNACATVASSDCKALGYCEVKVAIARGPVIPQNRITSDLRRPEIQKSPGGACPRTPIAYALRARIRLPRTVLSSHSPTGTVRMSFHCPCKGYSLGSYGRYRVYIIVLRLFRRWGASVPAGVQL